LGSRRRRQKILQQQRPRQAHRGFEEQLPAFLIFLAYCGRLESNAIQGCPVPPQYIVNKIKRRRKKAAKEADNVAFSLAGIKDSDMKHFTTEPVVVN